MVDVISVVGLTITVLDGILKLGERTAELIAESRSFDEDSRNLSKDMADENTRTRLLRALLFSESSEYGGSTLFEQFDPDIQQQIELLLNELKSILQEGVDILDRRYGRELDPKVAYIRPESTSNLSTSSTLVSPTGVSLPHRKSSPSFPALFMWSFRDKKRVEAILRHFHDQNSRIHEKIKLWCLASQLGVNVQHLRRLQNDEASKGLGFDVDATLRLTQRDAEVMSRSLELVGESWNDCIKPIPPKPNQGRFTTFVKDDRVMIQENHSYDSALGRPSSIDQGLDARTKGKVEALAKLLHQPKEQVFRIPRCVGWRYIPQDMSIAFVFEVQPKPEGEATSLLRLLSDRKMRPELGNKFRLALGLANCIAQLHMVKWVHESFRSENVIFFPRVVENEQEIDFTNPMVLGFELTRPEAFFSAGLSDFLPARDIYRHPERQGQPQATFTKIHDIYALGVILLEIGLWEPAITLEKHMFANASNAYAVKSQLIKHAKKRLEFHVGRKYKETVVRCLTGEFGVTDDTKEDLKLQQAFRTQVVDVLENAAKFL